MRPESSLSVGVIVLAAGQSQRMGALKPLLRLGDKTLLEHILTNPFVSRDDVSPVVVLGHEAETIRGTVSLSVPWVLNPRYLKGRTTSVQCGLRALPQGAVGAFIWPVDCPLVPGSVLEDLLGAFEGPGAICIPSADSRRGHPPLIGAAFFDEILAMGEDQPLRTLYQRNQDSIVHVPVETDTVLHNMNTIADFEAVQSRYESQLASMERTEP